MTGFIGSNLLETLLKLKQKVVGLDNLFTGHKHNLEEVKGLVTSKQWGNLTFTDGDMRNIEVCRKACTDVDYVLYQTALGSVPRPIEVPIQTNENNISGFLNMLIAARDAEIKRMVMQPQALHMAAIQTFQRLGLGVRMRRLWLRVCR